MDSIFSTLLMLFTSAVMLNQSTPIRPVVVCIDPGHPSENGEGAKGKHVNELELVWKVSGRTAELLRGLSSNVKVVMTKSSLREKVTNRRRAEIANDAHADLCLRVHADSGGRSGFATYYPDRAATVQGTTGPSQDVLDRSHRAALVFHRTATEALCGDLPDLGAMTEQKTMIGARQGALTGSVFSRVPVVLVELCAVDNPHDAQFAASPEGVEKFAQALAKGVAAAVGLPQERSR